METNEIMTNNEAIEDGVIEVINSNHEKAIVAVCGGCLAIGIGIAGALIIRKLIKKKQAAKLEMVSNDMIDDSDVVEASVVDDSEEE